MKYSQAKQKKFNQPNIVRMFIYSRSFGENSHVSTCFAPILCGRLLSVIWNFLSVSLLNDAPFPQILSFLLFCFSTLSFSFLSYAIILLLLFLIVLSDVFSNEKKKDFQIELSYIFRRVSKFLLLRSQSIFTIHYY